MQYDRHKTRLVRYYGGSVSTMPNLPTIFFSSTLANMSSPDDSLRSAPTKPQIHSPKRLKSWACIEVEDPRFVSNMLATNIIRILAQMERIRDEPFAFPFSFLSPATSCMTFCGPKCPSASVALETDPSWFMPKRSFWIFVKSMALHVLIASATSLIKACRYVHWEVVQTLLRFRCDVNFSL